MNEKLRTLPDGTGKPSDDPQWFNTAIERQGKETIGSEFGEIWWPFAIHFDVATELQHITHLPSGRNFGVPLKLRAARRLVLALRALGLDWNFTKPKGKKWDIVKVQARPTLERFCVLKPRAALQAHETPAP